jgi:HrpA-like RNA helicase
MQDSKAASEESGRLQRRLESFQQSAAGKKWAQHRQNLPVWGIRQGILDNLAEQDVLVVGGDTGCGKTTQVRFFLFRDGGFPPSDLFRLQQNDMSEQWVAA